MLQLSSGSPTPWSNTVGGDDLITNGAAATVNYSLIETPSATAATALAAGTGNLTGGDPMLGALADNGGATLTILPLAGSPLINAGNPAAAGAPTTDQRGLARISGPRIDIGAVEVQAVLAATGTNDPLLPIGTGALLFLLGAIALLATRRRAAA